MHFDDLNLDDILADYAKISKESGLDKTSTYTLPVEQVTHSDGPAELPFYEELYKMAEEDRSMYGVNTPALDGDWPQGDAKLEGIDAKDDLAVVHDLDGQQKKIMDVATKEVKLAEVVHQLAALANELDAAKLIAFANKVDRIAAFAAHDPKVVTASAADQHISRLEKALLALNAPVRMAQGEGKIHMQGALTQAHKALAEVKYDLGNDSTPDLTLLHESLSGLQEFNLGSAQRLLDFAKDALARLEESLRLESAQTSAPDPAQKPEQAKTRHKAHQGMLAVQKKINQIAAVLEELTGKELARVNENGNQGDKFTWKVVKEQFNLNAPRDFKNYRTLLEKLEGKLNEYELGVERVPGQPGEYTEAPATLPTEETVVTPQTPAAQRRTPA